MKFLFIPKTHDLSIIDIVSKKNSSIVYFNNGKNQASMLAEDVTKEFLLEFYSNGVIQEEDMPEHIAAVFSSLLNPTSVDVPTFNSESLSLHLFTGRKVVYYHYKAIQSKAQALLAKNYRDALDILGLTDSLLSTPKYKLMKGLAYLKNEKLVLGKRKEGDDGCPGVDGIFEHQLFNLMVLKN